MNQPLPAATRQARHSQGLIPHEVQNRGFSIVRELLPQSAIDEMIGSLGFASGAGQRGMLGHPAVHCLANSARIIEVVRPYLPDSPRPVRAIYFDKAPGTNWLVAWHQDLTIAVTHQADATGFGPWSKKDGVIHVQPPVDVVQRMITLRLHLDDTDESNGALRLLPGSHVHGRLAAPDIERLRATIPEETCLASRGDALLMRPLILHASSRSTSDRHRRILHIEYAGIDLPDGLRWNHAA